MLPLATSRTHGLPATSIAMNSVSGAIFRSPRRPAGRTHGRHALHTRVRRRVRTRRPERIICGQAVREKLGAVSAANRTADKTSLRSVFSIIIRTASHRRPEEFDLIAAASASAADEDGARECPQPPSDHLLPSGERKPTGGQI